MEILSNASLGHGRWHSLLHLWFIAQAMFVVAMGVYYALPLGPGTVFSSGWLNEMSEMFDNYAGGFVRRGLFGEVIIWLHHATGIHPYVVLSATMLLSYAVLAWYFVRQFRHRGYCWYFLVTCLVFGSAVAYGAMMRRMFLVVFFLCVVLLLKNMRPWVALVLGNILTMIGLLCYEPYFFFSVPMFVLLTHAKGGSWLRACAAWLPSVAVFLVCCVCHGNPEQFEVMKEAAFPYVGNQTSLMNFIQMGFLPLAKYHIKVNYLSCPWHVPSILVNIVSLAYVLYIATNGVLAFERQNGETRKKRWALFEIVSFQLFTQLPMFLILSIDYGRICCFSVMTAYIVFLVFDDDFLERLLPSWLNVKAHKLCDCMVRWIVPSRTLVIACFLFVGISYVGGNVLRVFRASMVGMELEIARKVWHNVKPIIQP